MDGEGRGAPFAADDTAENSWLLSENKISERSGVECERDTMAFSQSLVPLNYSPRSIFFSPYSSELDFRLRTSRT